MCQYQVILIDFIKLDDRWDLEIIKNGIYSQSEYDEKKTVVQKRSDWAHADGKRHTDQSK